MMHDPGKSDRPVVPAKSRNNAPERAADVMEGRGRTKGNTPERTAFRTQRRADAPSALERVRQRARRNRTQRFTTLLHHVYAVDHLRTAYLAIKRDAVPGVDGETWQQYGADLEAHLQDLSERLRRGAYRAKPVRRAYIPKADGRPRPLGVPALEDKIVQRAVVEALHAIYEADFRGFSYGFRPRRSPHQALDALTVGITTKKVNWVLDADIQSFFDTVEHGWLLRFLEHRVADRRVLRLIQKWLSAGVLDEGQRIVTEVGTVQGGSISPLLANVYLHYVFDLWVHQWRQRHALGDVIVVRYADDFVMGFQRREEAEQCLADLRTRCAQFGLTLHPTKTRLLEFGRFAARDRRARGEGKPASFNFLGFTHSGATARTGKFVVLRRTMRTRVQAKLKAVKTELRQRMHRPVPELGAYVRAVVQGHMQYYAVPMNYRSVYAFARAVGRLWWQTLCRRSQRRLSWARMRHYITRWVPPLHICHPYPFDRFRVRTQGGSRMR
jgi:RNA-directed DNA polymerase